MLFRLPNESVNSDWLPSPLNIHLQGPDGTFVRPKIHNNGDGTFTVTYTPEDVGPYNVSVKFGGKPVPGAPFTVRTSPTGDASKVKIPGRTRSKTRVLLVTRWVNHRVSILPDGIRTTIPVGEECVININTEEAGYGNVTCRIHSNTGSDVDIDIVDNGDGTVSVMYTPRVPGAYTLNLKFGGQPIPNGTITQQVKL